MDDVTYVRERIESYADYTDQDARHLVDKQIRAWVGEALSRLRERLAPPAESGAALDALLLHCEFSDQRVIRAADHGSFGEPGLMDRIHGFDRALVEIAENAGEIDLPHLSGYIQRIDALFEERFGAIKAAQEAERSVLREGPERRPVCER